MKAGRSAQAAAAVLALALFAGESAADDESATPETQVIVVDVSTLPAGEIPSPPAESDAPTAVPAWTQPATISVTTVGQLPRPRRHGKPTALIIVKKSGLVSKQTGVVRLVSVAPTSPSTDVIYPPASGATEFEAPAAQKLSCGDRRSVLPMRWESFITTPRGEARLSVNDLWFDAKACTVGPGPVTTIPFAAIAWEGGKPWLFAMRSHAGVTLIMPRASELSSESMIGTPVAVRGDFTRITMPIGRWGSGSIVAQLDSLTRADEDDQDDHVDRSVEVGIELVQTMSEKAPTLLVRTRRASAATPDEGRD